MKILNSCQFSLFGSEFLNVFWRSLLGIRISQKNHFSFGVPRGNQKFYAELLMGIRISELLFGLLYGGSEFLRVFWTSFWGSEFLNGFWTSFWRSEFLNVFWTSLWGSEFLNVFFDFFNGDRNFWTFSFQIFMEIRNLEFSPESRSSHKVAERSIQNRVKLNSEKCKELRT